MKKIWTSHCKDEAEKEEWKAQLASANRVVKKLEEILQSRLEKVSTDRRSLKSFLIQNWPAHQADRNATERTLLEIIELLPLEK